MQPKHQDRQMLFVRWGKILPLAIFWFGLTGCRTGPLAEFYGLNPFNRQGPEETEYGLSPAERLDEIHATAKRLRNLPPAEKIRIGADLALQMQNETDPIVRADIVRALGKVNTESASEALSMAMHDAEKNVRLAAAEAWADMGGPEAVAALNELVTNDTDIDVRLAATRALGRFSDPVAMQGLAVALEDPSPAMRYRAMEALKQSSGRDLGQDIVAWQTFIDNVAPQPAPGEGPTVADRYPGRF